MVPVNCKSNDSIKGLSQITRNADALGNEAIGSPKRRVKTRLGI